MTHSLLMHTQCNTHSTDTQHRGQGSVQGHTIHSHSKYIHTNQAPYKQHMHKASTAQYKTTHAQQQHTDKHHYCLRFLRFVAGEDVGVELGAARLRDTDTERGLACNKNLRPKGN